MPTPLLERKSVTQLASRDDVDALLLRARYFFGAQGLGKVVLHFPDLPSSVRNAFEVRLNEAARECGCGMGGVTAAIGLLAYLVFLFTTVGSVRQWRVGNLLWGVLLCLACAAAGKIAGLISARFLLIQELRRLKSRLECGGY
jgi:hypothetical protein